ncbi:riboflavin aldehyde-forming enzyme [Tricholoma matsutake]|nr:riboflavin aldehyde-forming enzyme [Tricholoma matsutake 945]
MPRVALFFIALFVSLFVVLASPIPTPDGTTAVDLEKRTVHSGGRGTWYYVGLGNCGNKDSGNQPIVAISKSLYDQNNGGNCNQWIKITANGKTAYGQVRDSCESCDMNSLDMSTSLFQQFASLSVGEIRISWEFMPKSFKP